MAAAQVDTAQLINPLESDGEQDRELEDIHDRQDYSSDSESEGGEAGGGSNSNSEDEGGVDADPAQRDIGVYDAVAPPVNNRPPNEGTCWQKTGRAVKGCVIGCCHDCKTIDKVLFVLHILLIVMGLAVGTVTTLSKISTHNQCYLKASYHPDGSMDYSPDLYWCDSLLYDALVTMSLGFLFIMVNWTAQLNKNNWWVWIRLALHLLGWLFQAASGIMLVIAYFSWCSSMESAMDANDDLKKVGNNKSDKCLKAAKYFDEDKNEESTLTNLYHFTLVSMGVALLAGVMWSVTLVIEIVHFCQHLYRKQDEHTEDEDDYHLGDNDSSDDDDNEGFRYPPYNENLVRRRPGGGYNLEGEGAGGARGAAEGAAGDGAEGDGDTQLRDVAA